MRRVILLVGLCAALLAPAAVAQKDGEPPPAPTIVLEPSPAPKATPAPVYLPAVAAP